MTDVLGIVSYATLRTTAGMSETDVGDAEIDTLNLQLEVEIDLEGWLPEYQEILDQSWTEPKSGASEFVRKRLQAYVKYYTAALLCKSASGLMLRKLSDGENIGERFNQNPAELTGQFMAKANEFKNMILEYLTPPSATAGSLFSIVRPTYDPVVGE